MNQWISELLRSARGLLRRPGFLVVAGATLALGIGVNAAIFSIVDALLLQPLPYANADRLVSIYNVETKRDRASGTTVPDYLDQRAQAQSLENAAVFQYAAVNLQGTGVPERLIAVRATPSLFPTLGAQSLLGRAFGEDEAVAGRDRVVVLSHHAWMQRFGGDPAIVGRDLRLDGESWRVVGVMPAGFFFPSSEVELWMPYTIRPEQREDGERGYSDIDGIGLLERGAGISTLETELRTIVARNAARSTELRDDYMHGGFAMHARPLAETWFGDLKPTLWLLQGTAILVLLITLFNVANLLLARLGERRREFALRAALGAGRLRIGRQVAGEVTLLMLAGGAGGVVVATAILPLLDRLGLTAAWSWSGISPRIGIATCAFALVLMAAFAITLGAVAWLSLGRADGADALRSASRATATPAARRARSALVVAQFALTLVLLASAGLLLKSFMRLQRTDPGFASAGLLTMRISLPKSRYGDDAAAANYVTRLLDGARSLAGVAQVAFTSSLPFDDHLGTSTFEAEGYAGADAQSLLAERQSVDAGYFDTLGIRLIEGRAFDARDTATSTPAVIVDEKLARHLWPGQSALGRRMRDDDKSPWKTVVGVVPSVHQNDLANKPSLDAMYWPYTQVPARFGELVVRSSLPTAALVPQLRAAALAVDAELPLYDVQTLDERIAHSLDARRTPMLMLGAFAGLALLLAAVGLYGVIAFLTARRTAELGVRMAVGASARDVLALVLGSGLRLCATGIAAGAAGAFVAGHLLRAELYDVDAADPAVFAGVAAVLVAAALLACWLPARRAMRIDPAIALRDE